MWFWIMVILAVIYAVFSEKAKNLPVKPIKQNKKNIDKTRAIGFRDPRLMTEEQFMRFLGYNPNDEWDRKCFRDDDDTPDKHLFDSDKGITVWNGKITAEIEYNGGTVDGPRVVDFTKLKLVQSADNMEMTAYCHKQRANRHFVLGRIKVIRFDNKEFTPVDFCNKVLRVKVYCYDKNDEYDIGCFMTELNGIPFNTEEHYDSFEIAKRAKQIIARIVK